VCHADENPHGTQFDDRTCADCHDESDWNEPPNFDHDLTAFPLDGEHVQVECAGCHGEDPATAVYRPLDFGACDDCHDDPHGGSMNDRCSSCHVTGGWLVVSASNVESRFDHRATRFPLNGAHASVECRACHQTGRPRADGRIHMTYEPGTARSTFPRPRFDTCARCHVEEHTDPLEPTRWEDCASCHTELRFAPSPFDVARHADTSFPLDGAHLVTPCVGCHLDPGQGHAVFTLALPDVGCAGCHTADDPHEGAYGDFACQDCHVTEAFEEASFDHARVTSGPSARACATCHAGDDPHAGQFTDRDCASCHGTETYALPDFDHTTTRFPLDGAHADASCTSCHVPEGPEGVVRYTPLGTECTDCHGEVR
jgi:hypothetical protein